MKRWDGGEWTDGVRCTRPMHATAEGAIQTVWGCPCTFRSAITRGGREVDQAGHGLQGFIHVRVRGGDGPRWPIFPGGYLFLLRRWQPSR